MIATTTKIGEVMEDVKRRGDRNRGEGLVTLSQGQERELEEDTLRGVHLL
jgi:hypothetical protein